MNLAPFSSELHITLKFSLFQEESDNSKDPELYELIAGEINIFIWNF